MSQFDEPVLWLMPDGNTVDKWGLQFYKNSGGESPYGGHPLYRKPQRAAWVGLTDEELRALEKQFSAERVRTSDEEYLVVYPGEYWQWQRAIEAKLKEKNT